MANGPSDSTSGTTSGNPKGSRPESRPGGRTPPPQHRIEVKDADAVQGQLLHSAHWIEDNAKMVIVLITIAIVGGIAYAAWAGLTNRQERIAQEAYYKAEAPFMKKREAFEKTKFKAFMPANPADKTPGETASGDIVKDYGSNLTEMESVAKDYAGTTGGSQAAIFVAQTYMDYKNADKAIEYAQLPALKLGKDHTLSQLGRILWGSALSEKGDCAQALTVWQPILDLKSAEFLSADVNLRMGTCLEKLGQNDRAAEAYRNAAKGGDSPSAQSAKSLLRNLELKTGTVTSAAAATAVSKEK
jgi:predicted negative regulator of RcsB-dependent stress response